MNTALQLPIPPADLRLRVAGTEDADWFLKSGEITLQLFKATLAHAGRKLGDFERILDWGCGCGRVTRWLIDETPAAALYGADIDAGAVEWLQSNMRNATVRRNEGLPPLPFGDTAFDLVLGYSVLTHLDEAYQDAWLAELSRRTAPGALLLLTIHGEAMWRQITEGGHPRIGELTSRRAEWDRKGILFWDGDDWERFFPAYYHTTFHTHAYVEAHWSKWFDVVDIREGTPELRQEVVILRRR